MKDVLIYYGWLNSFNSAQNCWDNEKVAQDLAKYDILVFGDGLQNPSHSDYSNTQTILTRLKVLRPDCIVYGYVTCNQSISDFRTKSDQWNTLEVDGIFIDEAGYDYGKTRSEFNDRVGYVHSLTNANCVIANAWNPKHVLGQENDSNYPNSTYNASGVNSLLDELDYILLENFGVTQSSYESASQWVSRGAVAVELREEFKVYFLAVSELSNSDGAAQAKFNFCHVGALMWGCDGHGTSDTGYAASSAAVTFWDRPDTASLDLWPVDEISVATDWNKKMRYFQSGKVVLDFTSGSESATITSFK
jgi:hypothetical protein